MTCKSVMCVEWLERFVVLGKLMIRRSVWWFRYSRSTGGGGLSIESPGRIVRGYQVLIALQTVGLRQSSYCGKRQTLFRDARDRDMAARSRRHASHGQVIWELFCKTSFSRLSFLRLRIPCERGSKYSRADRRGCALGSCCSSAKKNQCVSSQIKT